MKKKISLVLVLALGLAAEVANADFTFGTPTNLGPPIWSGYDPQGCCFSPDGLELYFSSTRPGGYGSWDIWVASRETVDAPWGELINLGANVNSQAGEIEPAISPDGLELYFTLYADYVIRVCSRPSKGAPWSNPEPLGPPVGAYDAYCPEVSADGLSLYFGSRRTGGYGDADIWVSNRATTSAPWKEPVNLGPIVNTGYYESYPSISSDGLALFFASERPGGYGDIDIWITTRPTTDAKWGPPVHYFKLNSVRQDYDPAISPDGSVLYFESPLAMWQSSITPIIDFNGDGIVDGADIYIMIDYWGTGEPLCDIGPMPWGDGIVDVQDLIVLAEHLFERIPPVEPPVELEEVYVDEGDDSSQLELEQGQILVVTLESNPTTGYRWEVVEIQESILEQMGEAEFKPSQTGEPPLVGAGGWEIFRFKAISAGQTSLKLVYHRPWEEGVEPVKTFSIKVVVN